MRRASAAFDRILQGCAAISGAIFALIALGISVNVVLRNGFGQPIYGLLDGVEYGLLLATFLGAPWVLWKNAHVSVDLITSTLPKGAAQRLARLVALVGTATCSIACWYALEAAITSAGRDSMIRTAFVIPEWWVLSVAPLGFALLSLEFCRQALSPPTLPTQTSGL